MTSNHASYFRIMSKKMRRTILRSPLQFLTMVLILALGTTLFSGLYSSHLTFKDQIDRIYEKSNIADISTILHYDYGNETSIEAQKDYETIKEVISDAGKVETQYNSSARIQGLDASVSMSDTYPTINKPSEIYSNFEEQDKNNYFLISNFYLTDKELYGERKNWIDDDGNFKEIEIELDIAGIKNRINEDEQKLIDVLEPYIINKDGINILDSEYLTMKVIPTGSMEHAENIASNSTNPFTFITTREFIKESLAKTINDNFNVGGLRTYVIAHSDDLDAKECLEILDTAVEKPFITNEYWCNNRYLTRLNNRNDASKYRNKIDDAFIGEEKLLYNINLVDTTANKQLDADLRQSLQLCFVFPPIFFLVGVLIVLTTISQIILKERKEIGTLKAIGASNRSILGYYMALTGIISLIGIAIGLVAGPLLIPMILNFKYSMIYQLPAIRFVFPTVASIIMAIVVVLLTTGVAFLVTRKEARALPIKSMYPKVVNIKKKNISESKDDKTHKLCFKMAVRNIFCSTSRSIMVIVGVLGCTALLCCGFGIDNSVQKGINNDTHMFFNTDSQILFSNPTSNTVTEIKNLQTEDGTPMIEAFEPYGLLPVNSQKVGIPDKMFSTNVYLIDTHDEKEYKFFNLGYEVRQNRIAISNKIAKELNVWEGDSLNFYFLGNHYTGYVAKVVDIFYMHGIFVDGVTGMFPSVEDYATCAFARFNPEVDKDKIIKAISEVEGVGNVVDKASLNDRITQISSSISYITTTIKIFAILLAVVSLYNLSLLNFKENTRNIATMKVLGFDRREVVESLFFEVIILSAVGALIGLALGYPLTRLVLGINQVPMCEYFYYVSAISFIGSLLITLGVSAIINIFVGLRVKKVKMVESLKSVE